MGSGIHIAQWRARQPRAQGHRLPGFHALKSHYREQSSGRGKGRDTPLFKTVFLHLQNGAKIHSRPTSVRHGGTRMLRQLQNLPPGCRTVKYGRGGRLVWGGWSQPPAATLLHPAQRGSLPAGLEDEGGSPGGTPDPRGRARTGAAAKPARDQPWLEPARDAPCRC